MNTKIMNLREAAKYIWKSEVTMQKYCKNWMIKFIIPWGWKWMQRKMREFKKEDLDIFLKWE